MSEKITAAREKVDECQRIYREATKAMHEALLELIIASEDLDKVLKADIGIGVYLEEVS